MHRSVRAALTAAAALAWASACGDDGRIKVLERGEADPALALASAVSEATRADASPQAYRELVLAIEELRPLHDPDLERRAERKLVFSALPPLAARAEAPLPDQVEELALTVWPTALDIEPRDGERPHDYLERACGDELARHCKYVVPSYRPLVVSELVWRRFRHRAQNALAACRECEDDPSYARALESFDEHQSAISSRRADVGARIHPRRWPRAAGRASSWPEAAPFLVIFANGRSQFRDQSIDYGGWRQAISEGRDGAEVLGVHLRPTADVALLRDIVGEAARAGYRDVALAAIAPEYPFERRAYLVAARDPHGSVRVRVRDVDTIQVLVQAIRATLDDPDQRVRF